MKKLILLCSFILLSLGVRAKTGQKDSVEINEIKYTPPTEVVVEEKEKTTTDSNAVYEYVDKFPTFPGGMDKYEKYLQKNITYPKAAIRDGVEGTVYITMLVDEHGKISNPKVVKTPHPALGEESLRVVNSMPNWNPAELEGKPVKVKTAVRIKYTLRDSKPDKKDNGAKIEKKK